MIKKIIKRFFNMFGFDIARLYENPKHTLLGLKNLPIMTIIDVGANEGQFAKEILKIFPDAFIYSFEPLSQPFEELKKLADKQNGKVKVFNLALGEKESVSEMLIHPEHTPSSSFLKTTNRCNELYPFTKSQEVIKVNMTTLDNWAKNFEVPLESEILIKLDVHGYEDRVIKGGNEIFIKAKACILEVGLDRLYEGQATFNELFALLSNLGFHYAGNLNQSYADDGHVIFIDAVFVRNKFKY